MFIHDIIDVYSVASDEAKELIVSLAFLRRDIRDVGKKDPHTRRY